MKKLLTPFLPTIALIFGILSGAIILVGKLLILVSDSLAYYPALGMANFYSALGCPDLALGWLRLYKNKEDKKQ